jgi:hypothetical protein
MSLSIKCYIFETFYFSASVNLVPSSCPELTEET